MKKLIGISMVVALAACVVLGDSVRTWNGDNGAPVYRVKNSGDSKVTITTAASTVTVTNGTQATTITLTEAYTVADLTAAIAACSNESAKLTLTVDGMCSLAADTVSNKMVAGQVSIPANTRTWVNGAKWDSSGVVHFDTYYPGVEEGGVGDAKVVTHLFGNVAGTGNITLVGYADRTEVYAKTIVSPIYVSAASSSATNYVTASDDVTMGNFDLKIDLPVARTEGILFRATRTTTATDSGGLGMILDLSK